MRRSAAMLCGVTVVLAGTITAVPANASVSPSANTAPTAKASWKACGTDDTPTLQCASVKVPLNHAKPQGKQITLALSRVPHTAKTYQGPLLVNPGGPGGSGLGLAGFVASSLPKEVAAQYDVIGFDPRGVGESQPALDCKPGHFAPVRPDSVPSTAAIEKANVARAKAFAQACGRKYADVLPYINTISAVQDMDSIRVALGAKKINYFGYSYGTYLGAVYAKMYPQRVRRLVLDSMVDPTGVWYDANIQQDYAFDKRHKALMAWIAKYDSTYKLGTDPKKIEAKWYAMRAALAKKPAGGKVGASELEDIFIPGGYNNGYWPTLAKTFAAYVNDHNTDALVKAYDNIAAIDASGDNGYSVYTSVQCRDASWPRDWNQWRKDNWAVYEKAPFMAWNNAWYNAPCAFWPTKPLKPVNVANSKLPPVLLFQATDDAATPYQGGVTMSRLLRGSSLVVEQGGGNHGITLSGNACLDKYLAAYLTDGKVPHGKGVADAVCQKSPDPKPQATATTALRTAQTAPATGETTLRGILGFRS
ncbi:alpha/beta hydrolase [Streptomyces turgidiscabies]|uniref:Hydrolase, alpha/beta domain protein n=1 Tax=Streptomyces turgidiscabies (strain Car8) TaxID=698760 RepID=L7EUY8_STRT8|nr:MULTISPECIES: alpha/beta hydrolase [Streptomyces]ELP63223.1 hydrolase, alpha/beta domain protein [Streptomyces turgidiscabies Car8]MDX3493181.1 alpha/beta hydrolase [Streptomyces turgidiscabies]GAQ70478.1 tripeptidyl aminopeptidase precursor [Streptomyces turgidiscabies]